MPFVLSRSNKSRYRPTLLLQPSKEATSIALKEYNKANSIEDRGIETVPLKMGIKLPRVPHPGELIANRPANNPLKQVPDMLGAGYFMAISERMKNAIADVEPDIHQFEPVTFFNSKEKSCGTRCYIWIVGKRIDFAIDFTRTSAPTDEYHGKRFVRLPAANARQQVIITRASVGDAHAWRSPELHLAVVISDRLHGKLTELSLIGVEFTEISEA